MNTTYKKLNSFVYIFVVSCVIFFKSLYWQGVSYKVDNCHALLHEQYFSKNYFLDRWYPVVVSVDVPALSTWANYHLNKGIILRMLPIVLLFLDNNLFLMIRPAYF